MSHRKLFKSWLSTGLACSATLVSLILGVIATQLMKGQCFLYKFGTEKLVESQDLVDEMKESV